MHLQSPPSDPTSQDFVALGRRVRAVQRKRLLVSALAVAVTALISVVGAVLMAWSASLLDVRPGGRLLVAIPFAAGIFAGWKVRTRLWPKDP